MKTTTTNLTSHATTHSQPLIWPYHRIITSFLFYLLFTNHHVQLVLLSRFPHNFQTNPLYFYLCNRYFWILSPATTLIIPLACRARSPSLAPQGRSIPISNEWCSGTQVGNPDSLEIITRTCLLTTFHISILSKNHIYKYIWKVIYLSLIWVLKPYTLYAFI